MRTRILFTGLVLAFFVLVSGCGNTRNCPVCGTTSAGGYINIDVIPVPEHNPTGEPGGPFNSFDISVVDPVNHRFFVSDRIGLDVVEIDTINDVAVGVITGDNGVAGAGDNPSVCDPSIPPIVTVMGNFTRFGCRTQSFHIPGFGANGHFGGFPGAQCCAARANGVNPLSGPDGETLSPDNNTLFVGNGSSSVVAFDLTCGGAPCTQTNVPGVLADFPTGQSPDYDGCNPAAGIPCGSPLGAGIPNPTGIAACVSSANGRAFSDPTCGDLRADEMSIGTINGSTILLVTNGDPGFPFATLIDVTGIVNHTAGPAGHCLPQNPALPYGPTNFPTCVIGQIYYDNVPGNDITVPIDTAAGPCPDPSTTLPSGVSGGTSGIPCHHGPVLNPDGSYCAAQTGPPATCFGAISLAGLGGSAFNPNTGHFLVSNGNASPSNLTVGTIDEIDPRLGNPAGPVVVNTFPMPSCMPTSIVQGPGNKFLVGCADHDGEAFPPNEYIIDGASGKILATINNVGGVDETWYNPGDKRYYLAARDMPNGAVLGIIDAVSNLWLENVPTGSNSHSVSVDPSNNHVFVPLQAAAGCTTQSANGCVAVYAEQ